MLSTRDPPQNKGHMQTKVKGWKKIFHANGDQKKAGVAILISDKIDFKKKAVKKDPVILEPRKIKSASVSTVSPSIFHEVMGQDAMILVF